MFCLKKISLSPSYTYDVFNDVSLALAFLFCRYQHKNRNYTSTPAQLSTRTIRRKSEGVQKVTLYTKKTLGREVDFSTKHFFKCIKVQANAGNEKLTHPKTINLFEILLS